MLPMPELVVETNKGTVSSAFDSLLVVLLVILNRELGFVSSFLTIFTRSSPIFSSKFTFLF